MAGDPVASLFIESQELEHKGEYSQAISRLQEAINVLEKDEAKGNQKPLAMIRIGWLEFLQGHYLEAKQTTDSGMALADPKTQAAYEGLINYAAIMAETNDLAGAEKIYTQAIELCRELALENLLYRGLHGVAVGVYLPRGQFDMALSFEREALLLVRRDPAKRPIWKFLNTIGWVHLMLGNVHELHEVLDSYQNELVPGTPSEGYYLVLRALSMMESNYEPEKVMSILDNARVIGEMRGDPGLITLVRVSHARYYIRLQKPSPALAWAEMAVDFARKVGYLHMLGIGLYVQAFALWLAGDLDEAERDLRESIEVTTRLDARYDNAYAWLLLSIIQYFHGRPGATETWVKAMRLILDGGYACLIEKTGGFAYQMFNESLSSRDPEEQKLSQALLADLKRIPAEPLQITTLGDFYIYQGGRRIDREELHQRRAGELLALLLSQSHEVISQDRALEALAPNESRTKQQTILYHATSTLRRLLEPNLPDKFPSRYLDVRNEQIHLILPPGSRLDYQEFLAHCKNKRYDQALGLYGGDWVSDYPYAEWALELREKLTHLYLESLNIRTQALLKHNNPEEALENSRRILALEPWNEVAARMAIQACAMMNDSVGAIRIYKKLQQALIDEFGLEPSVEVREQFDRIMAETRQKS